MEKLRKKRGIMLIALVVTIIFLLILAGVSIQLIGGSNGILKRASQALDVNDKATATEKMELKITYLNMVSYGENTRKATLQELADGLFEDKDVEYVKLKNQEVASLEPIDVTGESSFFVKLKEYAYEFEIDENLQLASVDGVKIANSNTESYDSLKSELEEMKNEIENLATTVSLLQNKNSKGMKLIKRNIQDASESGKLTQSGVWKEVETVSLSGYGSGKAIINFNATTADYVCTKFEIAISINSAFIANDNVIDNNGTNSLRTSCSAIIDYSENTEVQFRMLKSSSVATVVPRYGYSILLIPEE